MPETRDTSPHDANRLRVFINYRRADTEGYAGRVYEALRRPIGGPNLFMDVDSMKPGQNFVKALDEAVAGCDVLLAMIGPAWLSQGDDGRRRIDDPLDYVRLEIVSALERDKVVIPLLFTGSRMPTVADLPEALHELPTRNALVVRHDRFRGDMAELIKELRRLQEAKAAASGAPVGEAASGAAGGPVAAGDPVAAGAPVGAAVDAPAVVGPPPVTRPAASDPRAATAATAATAAVAVQPRHLDPRALGVFGVAGIVLVAAAAILLPGILGGGATTTPSPSTAGGAIGGPSSGPSASVAASILTTPPASPVPTPLAVLSPGPSGSGPVSEDARYPSPDGSLVAIVRLEANGYHEIYVERADGTGRIDVTNHPDGDLFVAWRPDGRRFAFISHRDLNDEVYAVDADGTHLTRLTTTAQDESWPAWSPDGLLIEFSRAAPDSSESDLWVMSPTGTEERQVTSGADDDSLPSWTPDGRIQFTRFGATGTQDYVVNADGSGLTPIP